jgi:hypothetical protein
MPAVYILINEAMPGYTKIGWTDQRVEERMRQLDTTGIPLPFECYFAVEVDAAQAIERDLHEAFADRRVRKNREWFEIDPERVAAALKPVLRLGGRDITPRDDVVETEEDSRALQHAREKRANFNFEMVKIPPGSVLTFTQKENENAIVVDNKKIRFRNQETSLSRAALVLLQEMGYGWTQVQGPRYWEFEGETLSERRRRMEAGDTD